MGERNIKELITKNDAKDKGTLVNIFEAIKLAVLILFIVVIIFMVPFIFPVLSTALIRWNVIDNIEQLEKYMHLFKGFNILIIIGIIIFMMHESDISFSEVFRNILNRDFSFKFGEKQVDIKRNGLELEHKDEAIKISNEVKEEAKTILLDESSTKKIYEEYRKTEMEAERESLRYFSAYKITDSCSRALLLYIKKNGRILVSDFKSNMEKYYQKTRGMGRQKRQEKVENLLYDLKYINVIEYTEDDFFIILTQNGKEFIENFYKKEVG